jgi:hypothetical protein
MEAKNSATETSLGHKQKVERAIQAGDVAVNTDAKSKNDFAHG